MRALIGMGREGVLGQRARIRQSKDEKNVLEVDRIQHEVAAQFPDNVTYVDAHAVADEPASTSRRSLTTTGKRVLMRAGDGIHLTGAGGDHLAFTIFQLLDLRWTIRAQAVPGQTKKTIAARGSTQVSGSGSSSSGVQRLVPLERILEREPIQRHDRDVGDHGHDPDHGQHPADGEHERDHGTVDAAAVRPVGSRLASVGSRP